MSNEMILQENESLRAERLENVENRIRDNMNRYAECVIDVGRCLNQAKAEKLVPHGQWRAWVFQHTGLSERSAQRLMKAAREIPNTSTLSHMTFSKVYALLALPPEEREDFAEEVGADEMSVRELKEAIEAKQAAEREKEAEQQRRIDLEKLMKRKEKEAAEEQSKLLGELEDLEKQLSEAGTSDDAQAELERLINEIAEQEAEIERRAEAEAKAKRDLLAFRSQVARGEVSSSNGETLTPEELGEITRAFIGRAAVLPHMRVQLATCDHIIRSAYKAHIEMVADWCERAMRAINTVEVEAIEV